MSMMEEFLGLQEKATKLEKEIAVKDDKILELTEKIAALTQEAMKNASDTRHFKSMVSGLETDKKNIERERDRLLKENEALSGQAKKFANMVETTNQTLQTKEELILSKEKQLLKKDELNIEKDAKIEEYRKQFTQMSEDKEKYQQEKFTFMEKMNKEKMELMEKAATLEKTMQVTDQKLAKFKDKARAAEDGLLGSSMEIEKLNEHNGKLNQQLQEAQKEIELLKTQMSSGGQAVQVQQAADSQVKANVANKAAESAQAIVTQQTELITQYKQKIAELEAHLTNTTKKFDEFKESIKKQSTAKPPEEEDVFGKGTGSYKSLSVLITHFKLKIGSAQRTLRLIVPEITDIQKQGLFEALEKISPQILKTIACNIELPKDNALLEEYKAKNFKVTDYKGSNIYALTIDSNEAALAVFDKQSSNITGVFSNNEELVKLLSQSIINPFIRGTKLN